MDRLSVRFFDYYSILTSLYSLSWNISDYKTDFIVLPGTAIWIPPFKIQDTVAAIDMKLNTEFYKIYPSGRVSAKFQKFVNGYCFIFPYFYPYDRHLCMISTFERSDSTHTFDITRWSVSRKAVQALNFKVIR